MDNKFIKIVNNKMFIIVLILVLISITLLVGTYAWFTWSSTDNTTLTMSIGNIADVTFTEGNQINSGLTPVFNYTDGLSTNFRINNMITGVTPVSYNVYLNITTIDPELISEDVKYALIKGDKLVSEGNLSSASNNSSITIYNNILAKGNTSYIFYLYIDANMENDLSMIGKTIVGTITVDAETLPNPTITEHIKNSYIASTPELITHSKDDGTSDTYYYSYQDEDNTWGLMNDGLKVADTPGTGATTITDTTALTSGTEGNIRFFGPNNKVNNYIYFNCDDYSDTSTCERWRIIGIVDNKVKIIRNESIGNLSWDDDYNNDTQTATYSNNWQTSSLQLFLNGLYYNRGTTESHTYYSKNDGTTTTTLDLKKIGITEATRANNMISEETWYLGGYTSQTNLYPNDIYNYERTNIVGTAVYGSNPYKLNANIGLMSASDYGYGTNLTKCSKDISNYHNSVNPSDCNDNNWFFNSRYQWIINSNLSGYDYAWNVLNNGRIYYSYAYNSDEVRPTLYLNDNIILSDGSGTYDNPYVISVNNTPVESPLQLGDYISYTPTKTSYPTDTDYTGYSSSQTIYPNELNLWRVLNKNDDGSVEIISEYVSSTDVYFSGQTGYLNLAGYLNTLAKQYETEGITVTNGSRHFGYNGQTEFLNPNNVAFTNPPPFTSSTIDNSNEAQGGGDILYLDDYNDVNTVLGTRVAYRAGTSTATSYWLSSRDYSYHFDFYFCWNVCVIDTTGEILKSYVYYYDGGFSSDNRSNSLRPIVTLKPGLEYTGQGTSGAPWQIVS